MLRRRVPVLRLGSRGPGGDARSLRLWTQASAIVRKRRTCVGHVSDMPETKIVAKRRTVVTFYVSYYKRVNSQQSQGSGRSKVSTVRGIGGVLGAKRSTVVTFRLASGDRRGERREEKREMRGEKRGEKRDEKRETKGERREERRERREKRRERRELRGEESG